MRGAIALASIVGFGMRALSWSRTVAEGDVPPRRSVLPATLVGVAVFVSIFAVIPAATPRQRRAHGVTFALVKAVARIALLVGYVAAIGRLPGIRRTFEYHGAEHQAAEAGHVLDLQHVRQYSPRHARWATDFLAIVAVSAALDEPPAEAEAA